MYYNEAKQLYSMELAERLWESLVKDIEHDDIQSVDRGIITLNCDLFGLIVDFLGGNFFCFNSNGDIDEARDNMRNHVMEKYNENHMRGNSYFVKTSIHAFEIGCLEYNIIDGAHELGHAFLSMEDVPENQVLWSSGSQEESEHMVNVFSRAFIMPRRRFKMAVAQNSEREKCNILGVSKTFGVDFLQAYIRGKELNMWD